MPFKTSMSCTGKFSKTENSQHATRTRNSQKRENTKIRKIRKQRTKILTTRIAQNPVKCGKNKRKSGKKHKQNREQNHWNKSIARIGEEARWSMPFPKMGMEKMNKYNNTQATCKVYNFWLCGMGAILCHAMLCMHLVDRRRCRVHGVHQNMDAE